MGQRRGLARRLARAVGYGVATALPLVALAFAVRTQVDSVIRFDENAIGEAIALTRNNPGLRQALVAWQEAFQPKVVYLVAGLACVYAWRRRHHLRSRAMWAFSTMMAAWFLAFALKLLVQRARPVLDDAVAQAPGFSFPSGHASNVTAATTLLLILFWPVLGRAGRVAASGVGVTVVTLTALDRVYLGVHYPSDVLAGVIFGVGLAAASYRGYLDWSPPEADQG